MRNVDGDGRVFPPRGGLIFVTLAASLILCATMGTDCSGKSGQLGQIISAQEPKQAVAESCQMLVVYTGGTRGNFEPCGCGGVYQGGLSRRATLLADLRAKGKPVLLVDTGDLVGGMKKAELLFMFEAHKLIDYDAVLLGERDLRSGLKTLFSSVEKYGVPVLASNVVAPDQEQWSKYVKDHLLVRKGKLQIGIVGLLGEKRFNSIPLRVRKKLQFIPPQQALDAAVSKLSGKADVVVLLSHMGPDDQADSLKCADVDLWIASSLHYAVPVRRRRAQPASRPAELTDNITGSPPVLACWKNDRKLSVASVDLIKGKPVKVLDVKQILISKQIKEQEKFLDIYQAFKFVSKREQRDLRPNASKIKYSSPEYCGTCHATQYKWWLETSHGYSFETLRKNNRHDDVNCWYCHTTGFQEVGGFVDFETTPEFGSVGCQLCHQLDPDKHEANPKVSVRIKRRARSTVTCRQCHIKERSPKFHLATYRDKIACPADAESTTQQTQPTTRAK